ncbi:hypothetical protein GCM10009779_24290 [Polymorphospora rubra]|uniref:Uncharacterized protein n=1 Tax=Polymorphospora rubra TaxID=338584 RepID=A0A810N087_9ACTN|nr:hypothetical protein [Polymorphospora rubra]BCJ66981.1 hypothetical protein Prubr_40020 [Polymorphospora rubra]
MGDEHRDLAETFRYHARREFDGCSPRQAQPATFPADHPDLTDPPFAARPGQRRPLRLAPVQYLLRPQGRRPPARGVPAALGGTRPVDAGFTAALACRPWSPGAPAGCPSRSWPGPDPRGRRLK